MNDKIWKYVFWLNFGLVGSFVGIIWTTSFLMESFGSIYFISIFTEILEGGFFFGLFVGFPLTAVVLSGIYQYKNPDINGYLKSLLITFSIVIAYFLTSFLVGIASFIVLIIKILGVVFIASVIINPAILFVSRRFLKK